MTFQIIATALLFIACWTMSVHLIAGSRWPEFEGLMSLSIGSIFTVCLLFLWVF